jgi:aconitate hydratase
VRATSPKGKVQEFEADVRIDTPAEAAYFRHGGILPYMLRQLLESEPAGV